MGVGVIGDTSNRRADDEPTRDFLLRVEHFDELHKTAAWTVVTGFDHRIDIACCTGKDGFNATIATIAHKAVDVEPRSLALNEHAKADTLHTPFNTHANAAAQGFRLCLLIVHARR